MAAAIQEGASGAGVELPPRQPPPPPNNGRTSTAEAMGRRDASRARLTESAKHETCGHVVAWQQIAASSGAGSAATCPVCGSLVGFVQDVGSAPNDSVPDSCTPTVEFKYGKVVYRLSVAQQQNNHGGAQQVERSWWMFWRGHDSCTTAQQRIMSVLGISRGMKVRGMSMIVRYCFAGRYFCSV